MTPPIPNVCRNRSEASTYNVELALDHSSSYAHSLGSRVIEGKQDGFVRLASDELEELHKIRLELEVCDVSTPESKN